MADPYEVFVRWYLRMNGYLSVENFVIHEPVFRGVPQGGEVDVLAVRFAHSHEKLADNLKLELDPKLLDPAIDKNVTDFVIAEVKSRKDSLNDLWKPPTSAKKRLRTEYIIRWLGFCNENNVARVATELQEKRSARSGRCRVRLLYFGPAIHGDVKKLGVPQITHTDVAHFIVNVRAPSYVAQYSAIRSAHSQWHPLIQKIWKLADPSHPRDDKCQKIIEILEQEKSRKDLDGVADE